MTANAVSSGQRGSHRSDLVGLACALSSFGHSATDESSQLRTGVIYLPCLNVYEAVLLRDDALGNCAMPKRPPKCARII